MRKARLFTNGGSQAVRLPADLRFEGDSVYIRRDERTGDVILSARPRHTWAEFLALREALGDEGLDLERDGPRQDRDPFPGWIE